MARFPGTAWTPLPEAGAPDGHVKTQFIVHSTGDNGTASATRRYFEGPTPNESTLIIGQGPWDPTLQIMDSTDRADANISASIRGISVEVVGDGIGGYNAWQRSELIRIGIDARRLHPGILPRVIPTHTESGYGWHVMFGAPGPWAGVAKECPGKQRIAELKADIFPAIFAGTDQGDDMAQADIDEIQRKLSLLLSVDGTPRDPREKTPGEQVLQGRVGYGVASLTGGPQNLDAVLAEVFSNARALVAAPGVDVDAKALAAALAPMLPTAVAGAVATMPGDQLAAIAKAVNDEADRRNRDGDPATGPVS